ncbi:MAG: RtcB family protein [Campylobacteraceae bacterium]|jgi:RNA-splicing ligase RtcB|nr:RtcB family protein [Campylobacteraceae bacterium]
MIKIVGKYNTAKVFANSLDNESREQIEKLCSQSFVKESTIRLMPDVHAGAGCTIGTTMTIKDKIVPNLVGVDIGCGMETLMIPADNAAAKEFDPVRLDKIIRLNIPSGMDIRDDAHEYVNKIALDKIKCPSFNPSRAQKSIGTLGGGNHFIEVNRDNDGNLYIVIHSGSRHLGKEVAEYYQEEAWKQRNKNTKADIAECIAKLKLEGLEKEIESKIAQIKTQTTTDIPRELAYVSGKLFDDYINDMKITQYFASLNRKAMLDVIIKGLGIAINAKFEQFSTIHNYIDTDTMIMRKGAVSAKKGEKLIVPINMRDGSIICEGLGNPDWNYSSPHGAGRIMSRRKALEMLKMEDYEKAMEGIYSTSVNHQTIDESPMAYKNMSDIISAMQPSVNILKIIKPIYNYKASEEKKIRKEKKSKKI